MLGLLRPHGLLLDIDGEREKARLEVVVGALVVLAITVHPPSADIASVRVLSGTRAATDFRPI